MKAVKALTTLTLLSFAPSFAMTFPATFTTTLGVIGDPAEFQINSFRFSNLELGTNHLTMGIDFNYGGGFIAGAFHSFTVPGFGWRDDRVYPVSSLGGRTEKLR